MSIVGQVLPEVNPQWQTDSPHYDNTDQQRKRESLSSFRLHNHGLGLHSRYPKNPPKSNPEVMETLKRSITTSIVLLLTAAGCGSNKLTDPGGDGWVFELVASGPRVGIHSSLATASDGTVYLAYHDDRLHNLHLAERTGVNQWIYTELDTSGWMGEFVDICVDAGDTLHLAYQDSWNRVIRYACFDGAAWEYEHLELFTSRGESPSLIARPDGIHLVEIDTGTDASGGYGELYYWRKSQSGWEKLSSISGSYYRPYLGYTYGADGPVIATISFYFPARPVRAWYWIRKYTSSDGYHPWTTTTVLFAESYTAVEYGNNAISVAIDHTGRCHLIYLGRDNVLIDTTCGVVDEGVSDSLIRLERGPTGDLWLLYRRGNDFILGHFDTGGEWAQTARVTGTRPDGRYDMHVDPSGKIHISFYDGASEELWYGQWEVGP